MAIRNLSGVKPYDFTLVEQERNRHRSEVGITQIGPLIIAKHEGPGAVHRIEKRLRERRTEGGQVQNLKIVVVVTAIVVAVRVDFDSKYLRFNHVACPSFSSFGYVQAPVSPYKEKKRGETKVKFCRSCGVELRQTHSQLPWPIPLS